MTGPLRTCMDCECRWRYTRKSAATDEVRCPKCRVLHGARTDARDLIDRMMADERGVRIVRAALEAAELAATNQPSVAGRASIAHHVHQLVLAKHADESTLRRLVVGLGSAAVLWASEIAGALDGR